jgi:Uma2 family endonuclease
MAVGASQRRYTLEEYLRLEEYANVKHELFDGHIYAMAGGTPEHGSYAANVIALLGSQLRGRPCRIQSSDVRIRVRATGLITYPDVSVVCGHAELDPDDRNAVVNPRLIVEVTSPSTDAYDRGEKLDHYRKIPELREVVFVAHESQRIDVVRREGDAWSSHSAGAGASIRLSSVDCELSVDEVYRDPLA